MRCGDSCSPLLACSPFSFMSGLKSMMSKAGTAASKAASQAMTRAQEAMEERQVHGCAVGCLGTQGGAALLTSPLFVAQSLLLAQTSAGNEP